MVWSPLTGLAVSCWIYCDFVGVHTAKRAGPPENREAGNAPPAVSSLEPRPPPAPGRCAVRLRSRAAERLELRGGAGEAQAVSNRYPHRRAHAGGRPGPPPPGARFQLRDFEVFDLGGRVSSSFNTQLSGNYHMVFLHSGERDFDLGGGFQHSGNYPMVFPTLWFVPRPRPPVRASVGFAR